MPKNPLAYAFENVTQDLLHLVKAFKRERAVFIGHDFGGAIVWAMAQHYPRACLAAVGINTPLTFYDSSTLQMFEANGGPIKTLGLLPPDSTGQRDYVVYFQTSATLSPPLNRRTMLAYFRSQINPDPKKNKANMQLGMRTSKTRVPIQPGRSGVRGVLGRVSRTHISVTRCGVRPRLARTPKPLPRLASRWRTIECLTATLRGI